MSDTGSLDYERNQQKSNEKLSLSGTKVQDDKSFPLRELFKAGGANICALGILIIFIGATIYYAKQLIDMNNYKNKATKQECFIFDHTFRKCSTEKGDYDSKKQYIYYAKSINKCGNITLMSEYTECSNSNYKYNVTNVTCYIINCNDRKFVLDSYDDTYSTVKTLVIISSIFSFIFCCIAVLCFASLIYGVHVYKLSKSTNNTQSKM
eukprot:64_1